MLYADLYVAENFPAMLSALLGVRMGVEVAGSYVRVS